MTTHFCSMDLPNDLKIKSGTEGQYSLLVDCQLFKNRHVNITLYGHILNYHDLSNIDKLFWKITALKTNLSLFKSKINIFDSPAHK